MGEKPECYLCAHAPHTHLVVNKSDKLNKTSYDPEKLYLTSFSAQKHEAGASFIERERKNLSLETFFRKLEFD